jgi:hypothetical protein
MIIITILRVNIHKRSEGRRHNLRFLGKHHRKVDPWTRWSLKLKGPSSHGLGREEGTLMTYDMKVVLCERDGGIILCMRCTIMPIWIMEGESGWKY